jgi:hypothetical protein
MFSLGHWNYNNHGHSELATNEAIKRMHPYPRGIGIQSFFDML